MPPPDQSFTLPLVYGNGATPEWTASPGPPIAASNLTSFRGTWGLRRAISRARSALVAMRLDEAMKAITQVSRLLGPLQDSKRDRYMPVLRLLEASAQVLADQLVVARTALMTLPVYTTDPIAAPLLRYLDWKRGECDEASMSDTADYLASPVGARAVAQIVSLCVSSALSFDRMQLTVSASLASDALQLARERYGPFSVMGLLPATLLAQVAYEQGRLEEAESLLRPRIALIRTSGTLECVARANIILARLALHRGQRRAALAILRDAEEIGHSRRWPRLVSLASSECSRMQSMIRSDDGRNDDGSSTASNGARHLSRAAAQLELTARLRRLSNAMEGHRYVEPHNIPGIETSLRRAALAIADKRLDDGYALLIQCLRIGATRGLRMIFVDSGRPLVTLLQGLYAALATTDPRLAQLRPYIATLLRFVVPIGAEEPEPPTYRSLSRREAAILERIARGMSNKYIAQALGITPETVKSHAKSIFVKLDARTRAQAVARAESIGLL